MNKQLLKWYFCKREMLPDLPEKFFNFWTNCGIPGMLPSIPPIIVFDNPKSYDIFHFCGGINRLEIYLKEGIIDREYFTLITTFYCFGKEGMEPTPEVVKDKDILLCSALTITDENIIRKHTILCNMGAKSVSMNFGFYSSCCRAQRLDEEVCISSISNSSLGFEEVFNAMIIMTTQGDTNTLDIPIDKENFKNIYILLKNSLVGNTRYQKMVTLEEMKNVYSGSNTNFNTLVEYFISKGFLLPCNYNAELNLNLEDTLYFVEDALYPTAYMDEEKAIIIANYFIYCDVGPRPYNNGIEEELLYKEKTSEKIKEYYNDILCYYNQYPEWFENLNKESLFELMKIYGLLITKQQYHRATFENICDLDLWFKKIEQNIRETELLMVKIIHDQQCQEKGKEIQQTLKLNIEELLDLSPYYELYVLFRKKMLEKDVQMNDGQDKEKFEISRLQLLHNYIKR